MNNLKAQPGAHFSSLDKTYEELCSKDYKFKTTDGQKERFMTEVYYPFLDSITENLEKRFPDLPLLESFQIFDPGLLPEDPVEKNSYGIDSLKTLATHFSLPWDETAQEWRTVVEYIERQRTLSASRIMVHVAKQLDTFPNLGKIAAAGLLVPTSTADCERGFSTLRRVKTELRSNLSDPILNCLLAVSLEGESVADFNISNCVDMWADVKKRRINLT